MDFTRVDRRLESVVPCNASGQHHGKHMLRWSSTSAVRHEPCKYRSRAFPETSQMEDHVWKQCGASTGAGQLHQMNPTQRGRGNKTARHHMASQRRIQASEQVGRLDHRWSAEAVQGLDTCRETTTFGRGSMLRIITVPTLPEVRQGESCESGREARIFEVLCAGCRTAPQA